ncbi:MAG TPA: phenylacetate--CoA ligase family protein [Anaerolineae bacterium]|nr:phenylacetate--CoA ligase family protein [Caldilineae bacterium]HID34443.1 phenylacetate--CoA ligase family protein [Anaerolineae bacterium]HIQ11783.1 phenylacetate--CoA ligase family protein [Caldilineales bacterium]
MSRYSRFLRKAVLPLGSRLAGYGDFLPYLESLEASQWWSYDQIQALQNAKLRRLIAHVYEHVPFYRQVMDQRGLKPADIQTADDLVKLPIVDKKALTQHYDAGLRDHSIPRKQLIHATSSGSTAERLHYWTTKSQKAKKWAGLFRWWEMVGYEFGDPYVTFQLAPNQGFKGWPLVGRLEWLLLRHHWLSAQEMTDEVLAQYVENLRAWRPKLFRSYASTLYYLAKRMNEAGLNVHVPAILTTGETLTDHMRETIARAFAPGEVFNEYGGDGMQIAAECHEHQGMHINAETYIVEIVKDGKRVAEGELGEVVLTNLEATATPFIRYNIHDVAALTTAPCACGRGLPRLSHLEGRLTDMFVTSDGHWLTVHQFTAFFAKVHSVKAFQVIQKEVDFIVIKLVVDDHFSQADHQRIIDTFRGYMGPNVRFELQFVDDIPTTPVGKRRFFISEVIQGAPSKV